MSCRRLQQLDLSSRQHSGDGAKLKFSAKDLRVLLKNNPGLR